MDDLRNYLMILRHGRPRSALQWELTSDYGLVYRMGTRIVPTKRFWMVKQLADLTPAGASYLDARTECADLLVVGFSKQRADHQNIALHLGNLGAARSLTITGLPSRISRLNLLRTSENLDLQFLTVVPVEAGTAILELSEQSLTTLVGRAPDRVRPRSGARR
jgi:hypothetical protein